jgi:DNA-binding CsgD family transcriptional regulator
VRFHIRSASFKLGAVNRDQTLFKAAQLGFFGMIR